VDRARLAIGALALAFVAVIGLLIYAQAPPQTWLVALLLFGLGFYRALRVLR